MANGCTREITNIIGWKLKITTPAEDVNSAKEFIYELERVSGDRELNYVDFCLCDSSVDLFNKDASEVTLDGEPINATFNTNEGDSTIECEGKVLRVNPTGSPIGEGIVGIKLVFDEEVEVVSSIIGMNAESGDPAQSNQWEGMCTFGCPSTPPPVTPSRKIML